MLTYTHFKKIGDDEGFKKLDKVILSNFRDLELILNYNINHNVHFYRLTSKLIPLSTHKEVVFDYINQYKNYFLKIGKIIRDNDMRVDSHPDQFCVLNSTNNDIVESSVNIIKYHKDIFNAMKINGKIILHVGSSKEGKKKSIDRFIKVFNSLDRNLRDSIIL